MVINVLDFATRHRHRHRLHNHNRLAEAGDKAIAFGKETSGGVKSNGLFRNARAFLQNGLGKLGIFGRVDHI